MIPYIEWAFGQAENFDKAVDTPKDQITDIIAEVGVKMLDLDFGDIKNLYTSDDPYHSDARTRANWKYGASVGVSGTPSAIVDGVKLDEYPASADAWKELLDSLTVKQA